MATAVVVAFEIHVGREYVYTSGLPAQCKGHTYKVVGMVKAVPSYQQQVLVRAVTGPDKGLLFVCSPWNFSTRYKEKEHAT